MTQYLVHPGDEHDIETPKEIYVSPEERQKIIDDLRLI